MSASGSVLKNSSGKYCSPVNNQPNDKQGAYTNSGLNGIASYNIAGLKFKGYYGDQQPAKKLFWI